MGFWAKLFGGDSAKEDDSEKPRKVSDEDQPRVVKDGDETKRGSQLDKEELEAKHREDLETPKYTERPKEEKMAGGAKKKSDKED
ncbi:hypothetical protein CWE09_01550 [Aliidiomarina minuta]|uniref:Uncharacterized protein n=1 Tax=Aliidiomarina minuta TaxID=880057 RepID=A0A432W5U9_9GAMM|nr:hypothetical protein [Aliidiomarina minuta]RUO25448.1 hypothetical protein CWE09_01550 [Aliidiomarina minuta]